MEEQKIKFNNGTCKETCNCIQIAEQENNKESVKNYPCLDNQNQKSLDDLIKY